MRAEGLKLREIGSRLGVGKQQALQMVRKFGLRVQRASRRTRYVFIARQDAAA